MVEKVIDKSEIIAVFWGRGEQEIIYMGTNEDGVDTDEDDNLEAEEKWMNCRDDWGMGLLC